MYIKPICTTSCRTVSHDNAIRFVVRDNKAVRSGFELWFLANQDDLQEEFADLSQADLTVEAAKSFKHLTSEEKKVRIEGLLFEHSIYSMREDMDFVIAQRC